MAWKNKKNSQRILDNAWSCFDNNWWQPCHEVQKQASVRFIHNHFPGMLQRNYRTPSGVQISIIKLFSLKNVNC